REYIFEDALRIVVAGTHGKTTTTGLLAEIFETSGAYPGYMIGGVPQGKEHGFAMGSGEFAIFEGDEYDTSYFNKMPKFLQYGAHTGIVTSVELDHLDIYSDLADYRKAFEFFVSEIPEDGFIFLNGDKDETRSLSMVSKSHVMTYGLSDKNNITARNLKKENGMQTFDFIYNGATLGQIETSLSGNHNVANILSAIGVALAHGLSFEFIKKGVKNFKGMKRRQEVVGDTNGILLIDDFAHHPTAVRETLFGIKQKYSRRRIVALFEPRSNSSRKKVFEKDYIESFDNADLVFIKIPPFREGDVPEDFMDAKFVAEKVSEKGVPMKVAENVENLVEIVWSEIKEGDVVIMMSNGAFDGLKDKLLDKLKQR
ncbi:MAG: UDP-N-acetylmuramate:L-alanyl-gamma-D-glutamyl-meso-diaminopimelate ligase, partial [Candidatus Pacebacteria bacterium]|nr:UDP-N-acetylmuramate:L-alanyl-gamma-D-glutamyl-meso-diaminopimelate ligase [Candidatus Paceibacterota bacterium]